MPRTKRDLATPRNRSRGSLPHPTHLVLAVLNHADDRLDSGLTGITEGSTICTGFREFVLPDAPLMPDCRDSAQVDLDRLWALFPRKINELLPLMSIPHRNSVHWFHTREAEAFAQGAEGCSSSNNRADQKWGDSTR